jgi:uncharacterized Zn finger protein
MTQLNSQLSLVLSVLQQVSTERLQKAVNALADGSLTVTLTRQTEQEIRALVKNGTGKEYGVTLTTTGAFCSCPDALYRGVTCKHATALALMALRKEDTLQEQKRLTIGDRVQQAGNPHKQGQVVCVSGEWASVWWDTGGITSCGVADLEPLAV